MSHTELGDDKVPELIRFECPHCRKRFKVKKIRKTRENDCPKCNGKFRLAPSADGNDIVVTKIGGAAPVSAVLDFDALDPLDPIQDSHASIELPPSPEPQPVIEYAELVESEPATSPLLATPIEMMAPNANSAKQTADSGNGRTMFYVLCGLVGFFTLALLGGGITLYILATDGSKEMVRGASSSDSASFGKSGKDAETAANVALASINDRVGNRVESDRDVMPEDNFAIGPNALPEEIRAQIEKAQQRVADRNKNAKSFSNDSASKTERDLRSAARRAEIAAFKKRIEETNRKLNQPKPETSTFSPNEVVANFEDVGYGVQALVLSAQHRLYAGQSGEKLLAFEIDPAAKIDELGDLKSINSIQQIVVSSDEKHLLVGGRKGRIEVYPLRDDGSIKLNGKRHFVGHSDSITSMTVSNDNTIVVSGDSDKRLRIWDLASCREQAVFDGFQGDIRTIAILKDRSFILASDGIKIIKINGKDFKQESTVKLDGSRYCQVATMSPDGKYLAVSQGFDLIIYNTETGQKESTIGGLKSLYRQMKFGSQGNYLFTAEKAVFQWDWRAQKLVNKYEIGGKYPTVRAFAISSDGKYLSAVDSSGDHLKVFKIRNGEETIATDEKATAVSE